MNSFDRKYNLILEEIIAEEIIEDFNSSVRSSSYRISSKIIDESVLESAFKSIYEKIVNALDKAKELSLSAYHKVVKAIVENPIVAKVLKYFGIGKDANSVSDEIGERLKSDGAIEIVDDKNCQRLYYRQREGQECCR